MSRILKRLQFDQYGHKFWPLSTDNDVSVECTYDKEGTIQRFYMNGFEIKQPDLIGELATLVMANDTLLDIKRYEIKEKKNENPRV